MRVLVTGGLGFIGSHTVVSLISNGYDVVIVDDLSNSKLSVLDRLETICGKSIDFEQINLLDYNSLDQVFFKYAIDFVIHFAAFKAVGESQEKPLEYYQNNLVSLINVLNCMRKHSVMEGQKQYARAYFRIPVRQSQSSPLHFSDILIPSELMKAG